MIEKNGAGVCLLGPVSHILNIALKKDHKRSFFGIAGKDGRLL